MRPRLRLLDDETIRRILDEAVDLLQSRGITLHHDALLARLADAGCPADADRHHVRIPADVVARCLETVPREIALWDVAGKDAIRLGGDDIHFTPGSAAIKVLDARTERMRPATVEDMLDYSRLVGQLPNIDYPSTAVVPSDVPGAIGDSIRLYALLKMARGPVVTGAFSIEGFDVMTELQLAVRGSREALRARPPAIFSACPTSPLRWSRATSDNVMKCAELGIPVELITMPLAGLVAPITLAGCLVQHAAETLSGVVISQTVSPGAPLVWGASPGAFDMRTMAPAVAGLEAQMICCAAAEVGKHLGMPTQAYIGLSDSKQLDAQAGLESGGGMLLAALAGINSASGPGMLHNESCQSLQKLVFDAEVCGMARRLARGIDAERGFPPAELFDILLAEGNLLGTDHTRRLLREEHYLPGPVIDRTPDRPDGEVPATLPDRAAHEVERLLDAYEPPEVLSKGQQRDLDDAMNRAAGAAGYTLPF